MNMTKSIVLGGIMLIGIGMLILTDWWWPGIMLVIGSAIAAERYLHGQVRQAITSFVLCLAIPLAIALSQHIDVPWNLTGAFLFIALGLMTLSKAALRHE